MGTLVRILCFFTLFCIQWVVCYHHYNVYHMEDFSYLELNLSEWGPNSTGIVKATSKLAYEEDLNSTLVLVAPSEVGIVLSFKSYDLRTRHKGKQCLDYLNISTELMPTVQLCGTAYFGNENFHVGAYSQSQKMRLQFVSTKTSTGVGWSGFYLTFTAYTQGNCSTAGNQNKDTFSCNNSQCIWKELICDGHNNCGDMSDEYCSRAAGGTSVAILLSALISLIIVSVLLYTVWRRRRMARTLPYSFTRHWTINSNPEDRFGNPYRAYNSI